MHAPDSSFARRPTSDSALARLQRAWQEGDEPDLETFVAGLGDISPRDLAALIEADFTARWSRDDRRKPEEYFRRFPDVASDPELAVDCIYAEYFARAQSGEQPDLGEYQVRFPAFAQTLAEQIRLHQAFDKLDEELVAANGHADPTEADFLPLREEISVETGYEILEKIGSGGMGVVFRARQAGLNRYVAIKMVRAIDASNHELLARFRAEARVVATLHHPHIVQVYDYGQHDDLPYIVMELVEGGTLANRLDGSPWAPHDTAGLMIKLADAVHFAHQRQVIHRDLKPTNVLMDAEAGELAVKITDFGLAKVLVDDSSQLTKSFAFLGTPSYMAPEQARGRAGEIGPAADIYSLGAILYELLTGRPPFRGETPVETLRLLISTEPASVCQFPPQVPRDLATICVKCLQGDPQRRYGSALELRDDLHRFLQGRPIQARPISSAERVWRWCRRNPYLAGALSAVALLLVGIAGVSLWYSARLSHELTKTRAANLAAENRLWDSYLSEAAARNASHQIGQRFAALESIDKATELLSSMPRDAQRERQLRNAVLSSVALSDLRELRSFALPQASPIACDMSLATDCCVVTSNDGLIAGYRVSDGQRLWIQEHLDKQTFPVLSPVGEYLATLDDDGARVWRVGDNGLQSIWQTPGARYFAFAPDGKYAAYSTQDGMRIANVEDGEEQRTIGSGSARSKFCIDASSGRIAVCVGETVQVIAGDRGEIEATLPAGVLQQPLLAWRPGGEYLAVWSDAEGIVVWHVESGTKVLSLLHQGMPAQLKFSADGSVLASQSLWNQRLLAWDIGSGKRFLEVPEFASQACDAGSDGHIVYLTVQDNKVVLSELLTGACRPLTTSLYSARAYWDHISFSPDGRIFACAGAQGFELRDVGANKRLFAREIGPCSVRFDGEGRLIVACRSGIYRFVRSVDTLPESGDDSGAISTTPTSRTIVRFGAVERLVTSLAPMTLSANNGGQTLLFEDASEWFLLHVDNELTKVGVKPQGDPRKSAVSDDGRFAAIARWEQGGAEVWDAKSGAKLTDLAVGRHGVLHFSPDSKLLAATPDGVTLWRTADWKCVRNLNARGTTPTGLGIAFSPDSRVLAVGQVNGMLSLFDTNTGEELARLTHRDQSVASLIVFSPDQRWLLTSSIDEGSTSQVWDLVALRCEMESRGLDWPTDVLRTAPRQQILEGALEVQFEDAGIFE
jgi:serine/threonine protein kinase/WD40 repeat protein